MKGGTGTAGGLVYLERASMKTLHKLHSVGWRRTGDSVARRKHRIEMIQKLQAVNERQADASETGERYHTLVESKTGARLKVKAMSSADARQRNLSVAALGYQWVAGGKGY